MNKHFTIKKYLLLAILVSMMAVLSYLDKLFSSIVVPFIPLIGPLMADIKIGFANIIVLFVISKFNFWDSLLSIVLKSIIIGLIYANLQTFLIGFCGTLLSFVVMKLLKNKLLATKFDIFISMVGGFTHMLGQIIMVSLFWGLNETIDIIVYAPIMLLFGLITGLIIGVIYYFTNKKIIIKDNFN